MSSLQNDTLAKYSLEMVYRQNIQNKRVKAIPHLLKQKARVAGLFSML
jgi:hypothetical protein